MITPSAATQNLITATNDAGLAGGAAPLGELSKQLDDGNPNNDGAACGKLDAFMKQVSVGTKNGRLTAAQADELLQAATAIKLSLGC